MAHVLKSFYFIRHGETDWNKDHKRMGQIDIPLNEKGIEQAHAAAKTLIDINFTSIVASPLRRSMETAHIIAASKSIHIHTFDEFKECSWGVMEGKNQDNEDWFDTWRDGNPIEGGEDFFTFKSRVIKGLKRTFMLQGPVLIVSHGGVYCAIQQALNLECAHFSNDDLPNCVPVFYQPPPNPGLPWIVSTLKPV